MNATLQGAVQPSHCSARAGEPPDSDGNPGPAPASGLLGRRSTKIQRQATRS